MLQPYELGDKWLSPDFILMKIDDRSKNDDGNSQAVKNG